MTRGTREVSIGSTGTNSGDSSVYVTSSSRVPLTREDSSESQSENECGDGIVLCCTCIVTFLSTIFCCRKKSKFAKMCIIDFWIVSISISLALVFALYIYKERHINTSPTDMRIVSKSAMMDFCDKAILTSNYKFHASLYSGYPSIDTKNRLSFNTSVSTTINWNEYDYWGFYLLKFSEVMVETCGHDILEQIIIKGNDNLSKWKIDKTCFSCKMSSRILPPCYDFPPNLPDRYTFTAAGTEDYYVIYVHNTWFDIPPVHVKVKFYLNRSTYTAKNVIREFDCAAGYPACPIQLDMSSEEPIVYVAPPVDRFDMWLDVSCKPRVLTYVLFFLVVPLLLSFVISILCVIPKCTLLRRTEGLESTDEPPPYQTVVNPRAPLWTHPGPPPTYEDLGNEPETPPPPYPGLVNYV